jgi:hypothetical protein
MTHGGVTVLFRPRKDGSDTMLRKFSCGSKREKRDKEFNYVVQSITYVHRVKPKGLPYKKFKIFRQFETVQKWKKSSETKSRRFILNGLKPSRNMGQEFGLWMVWAKPSGISNGFPKPSKINNFFLSIRFLSRYIYIYIINYKMIGYFRPGGPQDRASSSSPSPPSTGHPAPSQPRRAHPWRSRYPSLPAPPEPETETQPTPTTQKPMTP